MISEQERITFHRQKQHTMLQDFAHHYYIPLQDWKIPAETKAIFLNHYQAHQETEKTQQAWEKTVHLGVEHSGPVPARMPLRIRAIAEEFAPRIAEACYIHNMIAGTRDTRLDAFHRDHDNKAKLGYIYKNHLCNELEARLIDAGLDTKSAYLTMGHILGQVIQCCYELDPQQAIYELRVNPLRHRGNSSDTTVSMERQRMQKYWHTETKLLEQWGKHEEKPAIFRDPFPPSSALGFG